MGSFSFWENEDMLNVCQWILAKQANHKQKHKKTYQTDLRDYEHTSQFACKDIQKSLGIGEIKGWCKNEHAIFKKQEWDRLDSHSPCKHDPCKINSINYILDQDWRLQSKYLMIHS